jgi:hypothetical protein
MFARRLIAGFSHAGFVGGGGQAFGLEAVQAGHLFGEPWVEMERSLVEMERSFCWAA